MRKNLLLYAAICVGVGALKATPVKAQVFVSTSDGMILQTEASTTAGATWGDSDNDGDLDVAVTDIFSGVQLFRNDGNGAFQLVAEFTEPLNAYGATWGDLDNDGDLDLVINSLSLGPRVFVNVRDNGFLYQETLLDGLGDIRDMNLVDFDNDGLIDVFLARRFGLGNVLLRNGGDYSFSGLDAIPEHLSDAVSGAWADYDYDGDVDLYVVNTSGQPNRLYQNDGAVLLPHMSLLADDEYDVSGEASSHSANWVDFDHDGDFDLFVANTFGSDDLYRNDGLNASRVTVFTPVNAGSVTEEVTASHSSVWGDVDNDGDFDLIVSNREGLSILHLNDGAGNFTSQSVGSAGYGFSPTLADYDNDGDLDLFITKGGPNFTEKNELYRNTTDASNNWLQVHCVGTVSNRSAIGAQVFIKSTMDGTARWQVQEVQTRSGRTGQSGLRLHFGLADASVVDSLVVAWPSGIQQVLEDVAPNQILTVVEEGEGGIDTAEEGGAGDQPFAIEAGHPNPFVSSTSVRVVVGRPGPVFVAVYDVLGRRVRTLLNEDIHQGYVDIAWDARDDGGRRLAAGVYLIRAIATEHRSAVNVTLVR